MTLNVDTAGIAGSLTKSFTVKGLHQSEGQLDKVSSCSKWRNDRNGTQRIDGGRGVVCEWREKSTRRCVEWQMTDEQRSKK
jgi:hypothetical protein